MTTLVSKTPKLSARLNVYTLEVGDGKVLELSRVGNYICWRRMGGLENSDWKQLVNVADLKPEKGVEYWTDDDKDEIMEYVVDNIDSLPISAITGLQTALNNKVEIESEVQSGSFMVATTSGDLECSGLCAGDLLTKSSYDSNNNGVVDNSEKLGGLPPSSYVKSEDTTELTNLEVLELWNRYIE